MMKRLLTLCMVMVLVAIAVTGVTLAYFTAADEETNTFTVGNVDIDLIESTLHRVNAGAGRVESTDNILVSPGVDLKGNRENSPTVSDTSWKGTYFSDEQIQKDAETYQSVYLENARIAPGTGYKKNPYVVNTGDNDAYVRIRVIIDSRLDALLDDSLYTSTAISSGEFTFTKTAEDGNNVYLFTRVAPLAPGEMTFFNVWGSVQMDTDVTNEMISAAKEAGYISNDGTFDVLVEADGMQADGFFSAEAAWTAFDEA